MKTTAKGKGGRKAPRKHNPAWADNTRALRQARRREALDTAARLAGFTSWSAFETAVLAGTARPAGGA